MRVLVVTNFVPDAAAPAARPLGPRPGRGDPPARGRGRGLQLPARLAPVHPGDAAAAAAAARRAPSTSSTPTTGCPAGARASPAPRPLVVSFHGTDVRHPLVGRLSRRLTRRIDLAAVVSRALFARRTGGPACRSCTGSAVLPCGPDLSRFGPMPRAEARRELGLDPDGRYLLFPANPARPEKRADRARGAGRGLRGGAAHRRRDRARPDAALDQRRQRRPRHLRLRGPRDDLHRGARLPGAGPLDPGRHRPLHPRRHRGHALRRLRRSRPGRPPSCRIWSPPTRGSTAPGGRRGSPPRGPRSARSRPTATFWPPRNRFVLR